MRLKSYKKPFLRIHPNVVTPNVFIEVHSEGLAWIPIEAFGNNGLLAVWESDLCCELLGIEPKRVNDTGKVIPNKKLSYRIFL